MVVGRHAAAQCDVGHEHLPLPERAACHDDTARGDHRAVARGSGLDEVAARLDRLDFAAAISCDGTCEVEYEDVLVGTASSSAPARTEEWLRLA